MKSLWDDEEAALCGDDPLALRVYTSRLIGQEPSLVLHGGGNTSVKATATDIFGRTDELLHVKGSGWDLATIEKNGFSPVRLDVLQRMAELESLPDEEMVRMQRAAMTHPTAPTPSVEAVLHAIIPYRFVDHTHADAVVTVTQTPNGVERITEIYGDRIFIIPYVMPGFVLAREVFLMTRDIDWAEVEALILLSHGLFTFGDDARSSYERMIQIVGEAEDYLDAHAPLDDDVVVAGEPVDTRRLARLRGAVSQAAGRAMTARVISAPRAVAFSTREDVARVATVGPLTPDHVLRTKQGAVVLGERHEEDVDRFAADYRAYFDRNSDGSLTCLDAAPRWAVWPATGVVAFGRDDADAAIVADIVAHTIPAIERAEKMGGWSALDEADLFDVEYWELEQSKLRKAEASPVHRGRVALVTGAASGIGRACVEKLHGDGAAVVALDRDASILGAFDHENIVGIACDVTNADEVADAVAAAVRRFGGIDIVVSNAGVFPASATIAELPAHDWDHSLAVNLTAHRTVLQACIPYLEHGVDPAVVFVGSKNVAAPGRGAGAYSVAKAGLAQLARVAALELSALGIRVNTVHPNDVFDTGMWTDDVLQARASAYGMTVDEYRTRNLLKVNVTSAHVAALISAVAGPLFSRTTGAQIPIDGGNERVV